MQLSVDDTEAASQLVIRTGVHRSGPAAMPPTDMIERRLRCQMEVRRRVLHEQLGASSLHVQVCAVRA